jgi:hypothetical protein
MLKVAIFIVEEQAPIGQSPLEFPMSKLRLTVIIFAIGLSATASAQRLTTDQRAACRPDFEKLCGDIKPGGGRIMECLSSKYDQLSDDCKKVVDSRKKQ